MMRGGNRQMRRMMDKMGLDMEEIPNVQEVIIKTDKKEIIIPKPSVTEMKSKENSIFQVIAESFEEKELEVPIFSEDDIMLVCPSYEGDMSILKNHISIITFLRPGIIKVQKKEGSFEEFFVQDGTVEYFNDNLVVLSASAINVKDLSKEFVDNLNKDTQDKLRDKNITDHDRYILNHKLDVLKEIRI